MGTEAEFDRAIAENPRDPLIRGVFGDWLCDQNDPRGPGYVAMGRLGLLPDTAMGLPGYHDGSGIREVLFDETITWPYYEVLGPGSRAGYTAVRASPDSALPRPWFLACWGISEDDVLLPWIMGLKLKVIDDQVALSFARLSHALQHRYGVEGLR